MEKHLKLNWGQRVYKRNQKHFVAKKQKLPREKRHKSNKGSYVKGTQEPTERAWLK